MRKKKKEKRKNHIFLISLIILCLITAYSFSKYVIQLSKMHIQRAKNFYFTSNILTEDKKTYELRDWNGKKIYTLEINLNNYDDEIRYTKDEIKYNFSAISSTPGVKLTTSDTGEGVLKANVKNQNKLTVNIEPTKNFAPGENIEIEINAKSTEPYEKNLCAIIKIYVEDEKTYIADLKDKSMQDFAELYIDTGRFENELTITYDNTKAILDNNNELLKDVKINKTGSKSSFNLKASSNSNYCIKFVKKNSEDTLKLNTDIAISNK